MQHLAVIPDGNRRWASQNKMASFFGHQKGLDVIKTAFQFCLKNGIKYFSLYAFSLENFRRDEAEKRYLFEQILAKAFTQQLPELIKHNIRVRFVGDRTLFPPSVREAIEQIEEQTRSFEALKVNILFCYGATAEITNAVKRIAALVRGGAIQLEDIDESMVRSALWTEDTPTPDLIIRTGGAVRLSNFMLYQAAYSEFMFLDDYWPAITEDHLQRCLEKFNTIKRNFGS